MNGLLCGSVAMVCISCITTAMRGEVLRYNLRLLRAGFQKFKVIDKSALSGLGLVRYLIVAPLPPLMMRTLADLRYGVLSSCLVNLRQSPKR